MDFLSKKHQYVFLNNNGIICRVHVHEINNTKFDIWVERNSKEYRDSVKMLTTLLIQIKRIEIPRIIIVANNKLGDGSISAYNPFQDVIYFNNKYSNPNLLRKTINKYSFASNEPADVLRHELGHKLHWDAAKRFYHVHKSIYNNVEEAKNDLDAPLEKYISRQVLLDASYLSRNTSVYAEKSFRYAKQNLKKNAVNEVIGEVIARHWSPDNKLNELIRKELNYGKYNENGYSYNS